MLHTYCMPGGPFGNYNLGNTGVHETGAQPCLRSTGYRKALDRRHVVAIWISMCQGFLSWSRLGGLVGLRAETCSCWHAGTRVGLATASIRQASLTMYKTCCAGHWFGLLHTFEPAGHADGCSVCILQPVGFTSCAERCRRQHASVQSGSAVLSMSKLLYNHSPTLHRDYPSKEIGNTCSTAHHRTKRANRVSDNRQPRIGQTQIWTRMACTGGRGQRRGHALGGAAPVRLPEPCT